MVRRICDLPPLSESLRDSESHLNVHSRGHAGPHGGCGYYIHVLFNRWEAVSHFARIVFFVKVLHLTSVRLVVMRQKYE